VRLQDFEPPQANQPLAWAIAYAAAGVSVFPVTAGRTPLTPHGFHNATTDAATIKGWWARHPYADAAWGLAASVVVVDLDAKSGRDGKRDFEAIEGKPPDAVETPIATTPTGGLHLYFGAGDRRLRQFSGAIPGHPGIDTRVGGKGFAILPGAGNGRAWLRPLSTPLAPAPAWLPDEKEDRGAAPAPAQPRASPFTRYGADTRVRRIALRVERAVEGERNSVTFWAACRLAELERDGLIDEAWGVELLALAASRAGLPDIEARRTIKSGFDHGRT
jgi:hypothetical protein